MPAPNIASRGCEIVKVDNPPTMVGIPAMSLRNKVVGKYGFSRVVSTTNPHTGEDYNFASKFTSLTKNQIVDAIMAIRRRNGATRVKSGTTRVTSLLNHILTDSVKVKPTSSTEDKATKSKLESMPDEILLQIFGYLDDINSTCLGLTRKKFYLIHFAQHGPVRFDDMEDIQISFPEAASWTKQQLQVLEREWPWCDICYSGPRSSLLRLHVRPCTLRLHIDDWMAIGGWFFCEKCKTYNQIGEDGEDEVCDKCAELTKG